MSKKTAIPLKLTIDSKEAASCPRMLKVLSTLELKVEKIPLSVGDFQIGNIGIVERKDYADFISSIKTNHLLEQIMGMVDAGFTRIVVIIEKFDNCFKIQEHGLPTERIMGFMARMIQYYGISFVPSPGVTGTARFLASFTKDILEKMDEEPSWHRTGKKHADRIGKVNFFLQSLAGCGAKTAKTIMETYATPMEFFHDIGENKTAITGISLQTWQAWRDILFSPHFDEKGKESEELNNKEEKMKEKTLKPRKLKVLVLSENKEKES